MQSKDEIFNTAAELDDPSVRSAFLDRSCGSDLQIRDEIVALLHHDNASDSFMAKPPNELATLIDTQTVEQKQLRSTMGLNGEDKTEVVTNSTNMPLPDQIGEYEIIDEIARGGMGVVYKARQARLNRIVALKMILTGRLASVEDVQRFHTEAELAANLKHPNIVAIYEVGEQNHQHYFSMDFVEGADLAEMIRDQPISAKQSAKYVRTVAVAVQHAHENGIIHRELKPSNILIDEHDQPQITDFGLARRLESDLSITSTGQILGTPSYMAPEQVSSKKGEIDETTDVYALGALLYELVCGAPPIQAETSAATLISVLEIEPKAPRHHSRSVPVDIDTIALKCLSKRQAERYSSAAEVADELNRFLNGEPLKARKLGLLSRGWRVCRRKPIHAALSVVIMLLCFVISAMFNTMGAEATFKTINPPKSYSSIEISKHPTHHFATAYIGHTAIVFEGVPMDPQRGKGSSSGKISQQGGRRYEFVLNKIGGCRAESTGGLPGVTTICVNGYEFHIVEEARNIVFAKGGFTTNYLLEAAPRELFVDSDGYVRHGKWPGNNPKRNPKKDKVERTTRI